MSAVMTKTDRRSERLPSPEIIRRRAERIRSSWSCEERKLRAELARRFLVSLSQQLD
jgi:hypothetical protein